LSIRVAPANVPPFAAVLDPLAGLTVVVLVGRAAARLLKRPETAHDELVPARERHVTTALGVPLTLVGASTLVGGPLAVPSDAGTVLLPGIVLLVYPDFTPSARG
jgi:hypothetical protein